MKYSYLGNKLNLSTLFLFIFFILGFNEIYGQYDKIIFEKDKSLKRSSLKLNKNVTIVLEKDLDTISGFIEGISKSNILMKMDGNYSLTTKNDSIFNNMKNEKIYIPYSEIKMFQFKKSNNSSGLSAGVIIFPLMALTSPIWARDDNNKYQWGTGAIFLGISSYFAITIIIDNKRSRKLNYDLSEWNIKVK